MTNDELRKKLLEEKGEDKVFCRKCSWTGLYKDTNPDQLGYCPECGQGIYSDNPDGRSHADFLNLNSHLDLARLADGYMVAVWRVSDGVLHYYRQTKNFPLEDFDAAMKQLKADIEKERAK